MAADAFALLLGRRVSALVYPGTTMVGRVLAVDDGQVLVQVEDHRESGERTEVPVVGTKVWTFGSLVRVEE